MASMVTVVDITVMAIKIKNKKDCCGCEACVQICHAGAISFIADSEGFSYPVVDQKKCNQCGACVRVCPVINIESTREPIEIYAAKNRDEQIRESSSSGGIFTIFANDVISKGGVVFGAGFNERWEVVHSFAQRVEDVAAFRGSKYVQSRIGDTFKEAKLFLEAGREVLFSGTPCQIAGLKSFLQKEYDNLLTVDLICHGVPSPAVWQRYLGEFCATSNLKKINFINFRDKRLGVKSHTFGLNIESEKEGGAEFSFYEQLTQNVYMKGFLRGLYLRPSCHSCPSRELRSGSDITIADFWGVDSIMPEFDDNRGVSLMIVNSSKVQQLIKNIGLNLVDISDRDSIFQRNIAYFTSHHPHKNRSNFFRKIQNPNTSIAEAILRYAKCEPTFCEKVNFNIKRYLRKFKLIR